MSLTAKTLQKLIDTHTADVVRQLAEKYEFDAEEALQALVVTAAKAKKPTKPRAKNAYMRFSAEERIKLKETEPDMPPKDVLKELGKRWSALSEEAKDPYVDAYNIEKAALAEQTPPAEQGASD